MPIIPITGRSRTLQAGLEATQFHLFDDTSHSPGGFLAIGSRCVFDWRSCARGSG